MSALFYTTCCVSVFHKNCLRISIANFREWKCAFSQVKRQKNLKVSQLLPVRRNIFSLFFQVPRFLRQQAKKKNFS